MRQNALAGRLEFLPQKKSVSDEQSRFMRRTIMRDRLVGDGAVRHTFPPKITCSTQDFCALSPNELEFINKRFSPTFAKRNSITIVWATNLVLLGTYQVQSKTTVATSTISPPF